MRVGMRRLTWILLTLVWIGFVVQVAVRLWPLEMPSTATVPLGYDTRLSDEFPEINSSVATKRGMMSAGATALAAGPPLAVYVVARIRRKQRHDSPPPRLPVS